MLKDKSFILKFTVGMVGLIAIFAIIVIGRNFLYPILLGILFSYLLFPVSRILEQWKLPRPIAIFISILFGMSVIGGLVFFLYSQLSFFLSDLPTFKTNVQSSLNDLQQKIENILSISVQSQKTWLRDTINSTFDGSTGMLSRTFSATTSAIFAIGIMPVYVFFMTFYRDKYQNFIMMLTSQENHDRTKMVINNLSDVTRKYVGGVVMVVLILIVLNSIGLLIVGVKYAIMFGILSALMNIIPYFGTLIGAAIPLSYTLLSGEPEKALGVLILFVIIQFTENNILTPNITGGSVQINPFFTILSIVLGGMVWGIPGMLVSVPLMGTVKIIFENIESLHPYAYLIGIQKRKKFIRLRALAKKRISKK